MSQALGAQEAAQQQSVNAAHEGWGFAMQRYQRGIGSYVEALNAEQLVLETESVLADIRTRKIDAAIQLVYALGGGYGGTSPGKALPATKPINKVSS